MTPPSHLRDHPGLAIFDSTLTLYKDLLQDAHNSSDAEMEHCIECIRDDIKDQQRDKHHFTVSYFKSHISKCIKGGMQTISENPPPEKHEEHRGASRVCKSCDFDKAVDDFPTGVNGIGHQWVCYDCKEEQEKEFKKASEEALMEETMAHDGDFYSVSVVTKVLGQMGGYDHHLVVVKATTEQLAVGRALNHPDIASQEIMSIVQKKHEIDNSLTEEEE